MTDTRINTALITTSEYKDLLLKTEIRDSKERYENAANEYRKKYDEVYSIVRKDYEDKIRDLNSKIYSLEKEVERLNHSNSELYWKVDTWKKIANRYKSHWAVKLFIGKKYETN